MHRPQGGRGIIAYMMSECPPCTLHMASKFIPKYPVRSVSGRKMIVASVSRRITSFISYDAI
jgi:hypothetical protein